MHLTRQQALDWFRSDDLIGLGMEADAVRLKLHPERTVTYVVDRGIRCAASGDFESVYRAAHETVETGGTGIHIRPAANELHDLVRFEGLLRGLRERFPSLHLHCFSASQILGVAQRGNPNISDILARLHAAGLNSLSGDNAGILCEGVRNGTASCSTEDWLTVHRTAHSMGIATTCSMTFGAGEEIEHRLNRLERLFELQQDTNGFVAFTPLSLHARSGWNSDEPTAVEYLKMLALSRLLLSNIPNVQASWIGQGLKVLQLGLRFGGNDVGSALPDPAKAEDGLTGCPDEEDLRRIIREAGFRPVQRDTLYRTCFLN